MASLTTSATGLTALTTAEGPMDGLYDDDSAYCTYGVGHLVHPTGMWNCFLLAAANTSDAWKAKLLVSLEKTYLPRAAATWADYAQLKAKAVELAQDVIAKKRHGKEFSKLGDAEKAAVKGTAEAAVEEESVLLPKVVSEVFKSDLTPYETAVNGTITGVSLTQDEFDALVSLTFNIGVDAFKSSTVAKKINENKYRSGDAKTREPAITEVENGFLAWNKSKGVVVAGLTDRRKKEATQFLKGARQELDALKLKTPTAAAAAGSKP